MAHNSDSTPVNPQGLFLQIANSCDQTALDPLLERHQLLLNATDDQGNTLLHYAVMVPVNLALLQRLVHRPDINLTTCNSQGNTAADWLWDYLSSAKRLIDPDELDQIPQKIAEGDTAFVISLLLTNISSNLRYRTAHHPAGMTLQQLAQHYQRSEILQQRHLISHDQARHRTNSSFLDCMLYIQNGSAQSLTDIAGAQAMLGKAEAALPPLPPVSQAVLPLPLRLLQQKIGALSTSTHPHQQEQLSAHLPTLCALAAFTCQNALHNLAVSLPISKQYQRLLKQLFGISYTDTKTIPQLQQKIFKIQQYLYNLVEQDCVSQFIALSTQRSNAGWFDSNENKIYLNPGKATYLIGLVGVLLHETSHLITKSYDFRIIKSPYLRRDYYKIDFYPCYQLANRGKSSYITDLPIKMQALLKCQSILQHGKKPAHPQKTYYQFLALNNADTIAMAIIGLGTQSQVSYDNFLSIPLNCFSDTIIKSGLDKWALIGIAAQRALSPPCHASPTISLISTKAGSDRPDDAAYSDNCLEDESADDLGHHHLPQAIAALSRPTGEQALSKPVEVSQHNMGDPAHPVSRLYDAQ